MDRGWPIVTLECGNQTLLEICDEGLVGPSTTKGATIGMQSGGTAVCEDLRYKPADGTCKIHNLQSQSRAKITKSTARL